MALLVYFINLIWWTFELWNSLACILSSMEGQWQNLLFLPDTAYQAALKAAKPISTTDA